MANETTTAPAPAKPRMKFGLLGCLGVILLVLVVVGLSGVGAYNSLNKLDQAVKSAWAQVENVYQRRADLVPNLVETVKGAASFEKETYTAVTEARAKVGQTKLDASQINDPAAFAKFQQALRPPCRG
jgi:LemA protein